MSNSIVELFARNGRQMAISCQQLLASVCLYLAVMAPDSIGAQTSGDVWVNTSSGVYHCPGMPYFGRTKRGLYLQEQLAISRGFRANGGTRCYRGTPDSIARRRALNEPSAGSMETPPLRKTECQLVEVIDADTIDCTEIGRVRLIGIDAPERSQQPFGKMADSALSAMIPKGAKLVLEFDISAKDRYGRALAYVWLASSMVNLKLVREGWAKSYRYPPDVRHASLLDSAQAVAKKERRGLWAFDSYTCDPGDRRRGRC